MYESTHSKVRKNNSDFRDIVKAISSKVFVTVIAIREIKGKKYNVGWAVYPAQPEFGVFKAEEGHPRQSRVLSSEDIEAGFK